MLVAQRFELWKLSTAKLRVNCVRRGCNPYLNGLLEVFIETVLFPLGREIRLPIGICRIMT